MPGLPHPTQEHLHPFVARGRLRLEQQAEDQGVPFTGLREIAKIADLEPSGLRRELADFGVGNAGQRRFRIEDGIQFGQAIRPLTDVLQRGRSWDSFKRAIPETCSPGGTSSRASRRFPCASLRPAVIER